VRFIGAATSSTRRSTSHTDSELILVGNLIRVRAARRQAAIRQISLFTIQSREVLEAIAETGVYRPDPARQYKEGGAFRFGYDWMRGEMEKRIGAPTGSGIVWVWQRPRPSAGWVHWYLPPGTDGVYLQLRVPRSRVLLSDYDAWEIAVARQEPLTFSDRQREIIERRVDGSAADPRLILGPTWTRMFDLKHKPFATGAGTFRCARVQGCLFEIRREDVISTRRVRHPGPEGRHPRGCVEMHHLVAKARGGLQDHTTPTRG
jgi:Domain of unknown function (DUF3841)